jgi:hypothetical protein
MNIDEINKQLSNPEISKELKDALEKRKEILLTNKFVKK